MKATVQIALVLLSALVAACGSSTAAPSASVASLGFAANPTSVAVGGTSTLSWSAINNATACSIDNGVGVVSCGAASASVAPQVTTIYTLTAKGAGTSVTTATATVNVTGTTAATVGGTTTTVPRIGSFTASPTTIPVGGSSTLSWKGIVNGSFCSINNNVGLVSCADGSTVVTPVATTTTSYTLPYTMTVTGISASITATANVTVTAH
jgi:hypothetical protein